MHDMHMSFSGHHNIIEDVPSRLSNSKPAMSAYPLGKGMQRLSHSQREREIYGIAGWMPIKGQASISPCRVYPHVEYIPMYSM